MADVGEDVFVLGYPLTQALGNEIKLTNGIISSRTGYQGDVANYQISAPVQPGNSGGPMFDSKGNVIGIVVAGVPGAENVGYAIKIAYLKLLIESAGLSIKFPANNTISTLSLSEKVKRVKNHVFYIECSR
jgi:S1-C subfamily serine protease